jgi:hypothetical protein
MKLEVLWRQLVGIGAEHLILGVDEDVHADVHADGMAVGEVESSAYRLRYELDCDQGWNVERLMVEDLLAHRSLTWARLQHDRWSDGSGHAIEALNGCKDVDLMVTPFTNTLPIRRLKLEPGESRQIAVVYVGVPGLAASRMEQRYTCLSRDNNGGIYRYESLKTGFTANLKVDTDGLVVDYPNIFVMDAKRRLAGD